jgi:hypothetical protein
VLQVFLHVHAIQVVLAHMNNSQPPCPLSIDFASLNALNALLISPIGLLTTAGCALEVVCLLVQPIDH